MSAFCHGEALSGSGVLEFAAVASGPAVKDVGQVVLFVIGAGKNPCGDRAQLVVRQHWCTSVVQAPSVSLKVVEPDIVGTPAVGLGERKNRGGYTGVWSELARAP